MLGTNADGKIIVNSGGSLMLNASGGLIIDGAVYVASGGSLAIAGTLSVREISLGPDAGTIGVFGTLSLPAGNPQQINISISGTAGVSVLGGIAGHKLTQCDCKKFIVRGANNSYYRVNLQGDTGVTAMVVARRNDGTMYASIQDAVKAATTGSSTNPDTITLLANIDISTAAGTISIPGNRHIKLVPGGATRTVKRGANGLGSLFYVESSASLTLEGNGGNQLIIDGNKDSVTEAAAALVTVSGGTFTMNAGAVLQNNNNNKSDGNGGGVYVGGGTFTMNAGAILQNNKSSNNGGGVYMSGGSFTMNGGAINGNTTAGDGGGVYVSGGSFTMSGGAINGNTTAGNGGGVHVSVDFTMSGGAIVAQDNDVYLANGKMINVGGLTGSGFAAKITPANPASNLKILSNASSSTIKRFTLSTGAEKWSIVFYGGYGELSDYKVYLSSNKQGYDTLKDAVNAAATTDTITLLATITLSDTIRITSGKHITIKLDPNSTEDRKVKRGASGFGSLFTVESAASLTLEGNGTKSLIINGNKNSVIDGNNVTATAALVTVRGTLTMNASVGIQNNNNNSGYGGGVYVGNGGRFNMNGGTISLNNATSGGGVYVGSGGIFNMDGGSTISGNSASGDGGGVYVGSGGSFTRTGGIIYGGTAGDDIKNTASSDGHGHALYDAGSGTATDSTFP
jgi:hypothetical protein